MTQSPCGFEFCSGDLFETRWIAACLAAAHRGFAFYVAHHVRSIHPRDPRFSVPCYLLATARFGPSLLDPKSM